MESLVNCFKVVKFDEFIGISNNQKITQANQHSLSIHSIQRKPHLFILRVNNNKYLHKVVSLSVLQHNKPKHCVESIREHNTFYCL